MARSQKLNRGWEFAPGPFDARRYLGGEHTGRTVNLPHDYMIETEVTPDAPARQSGGYYTAGVAHYVRETDIPAEWENDRVFLRFDGAMMNATVEVNGSRAALTHYGYAPFETEITSLVYPGRTNRITVTLNPSMQPNSRWYSGAGLFRDVSLVHTPRVRAACGGLSGITRKIEYGEDGTPRTAFLAVACEVQNGCAENRLCEVTFSLKDETDGTTVASSQTLVEVQPLSAAEARTTLTIDNPALWSAESPSLYRLEARVRAFATYKTHMVPLAEPTEDAEDVLFGIRTVEADVRNGLLINGKPVKLKGGCLHHDNGVIGAVSLYDAEARKIRKLKQIGFNAVRTTHNPPSAALIEACDRLGMYVFDEAFDAWGMGKQPGDYNQYFDTDWEKDLAAFVRRDRCHPSVILWSTGNEITERAGLNNGYVLQDLLSAAIRKLDPSRPVSNAVCSFWNGVDDDLLKELQRRAQSGAEDTQNGDIAGSADLLWEEYTRGFANALDIFGYNYLEGKYGQDLARFPERIILGSENFPKEIGIHWPEIEKNPRLLGDFTWTAWDYLGEAGIGKAVFHDEGDPERGSSWQSPFPWRTANDADFDITGQPRPQAFYRRIVWGSPETALFSYDPAAAGKQETLTAWGFPGVWGIWNWPGQENRPVDIAVFSAAQETELFLNGESCGRLQQGEAPVHDMPLTLRFRTVYRPGTLEAVSYRDGKEVSRAVLRTAGTPAGIRLVCDRPCLAADGSSLAYVEAVLTDADGNAVPDADRVLTAEATGDAELLGFGSGNPVTAENYTCGRFTSYHGRVLAVLRAGYTGGSVRLTVRADGLPDAELTLPVKA